MPLQLVLPVDPVPRAADNPPQLFGIGVKHCSWLAELVADYRSSFRALAQQTLTTDDAVHRGRWKSKQGRQEVRPAATATTELDDRRFLGE